MAFDNVTLFEVHLDDAKLSTFFGSESAEEDHRDDEMIVEAASDDAMDAEMDADAHVEMGDDAEHVEIDEAAPQ